MMKKLTALLLAALLLLGTMSSAMAWSCPSCGNDMSGKFCTECGTKKPEDNICPGCGTNYGDAAPKFCSECGTKMGDATPAVPKTELKITKQPQNVTVASGETATVSVVAQGEGLTYEWYFKNKGGKSFSKTDSFKGDSYAVEMNAERDGRQVYCVVKDKHGKSVQSETVTIRMASGVKLLGQINDVTVANGEKARVIITAEGEGLTYVWYFKNKGASSFTKTDAFNGPTYEVVMNAERDGRQLYCVVTDKYGNSVQSEIITINMISGVPENFNIFDNENGTVSVFWQADPALTYQVRYVHRKSNDVDADIMADDSFGYFFKESSSGFEVLKTLIPGEKYWIGVFNAEDEGEYVAYEPSQPVEPFSLFSNELITWLQLRQDGEDTEVEYFTVEQAASVSDVECGLTVAMRYNNPGELYVPLTQIVFEAPNGAKEVAYSTYAEFEADTEDVTGWSFASLSDFTLDMEEMFDGMVAGEYKVSVYLDGMHLGTQSFEVREKAAGTVPGTPGTPPSGTTPGTTTPGGGMMISSGQSTGAPTIVSAVENANGTVTLTWEDNGKGPFSVEYVYCVIGNIEEDKDLPYAWWTEETDITGTSHELAYLIPGRVYWLIVKDSTGAAAELRHKMQTPGRSDLNMNVDLYPRRNDNGTYTNLTTFSASVLNQDYSESYGLYLDLNYNRLPSDRKMNGMFVLTIPDGTPLVLRAGDMNMFAGGSTYWECYTLDWPFSRVKKWCGEVLKGEYKIDVYIEGEHAAKATFEVK